MYTQLLQPAFLLLPPALAITALALPGMCRACICICGADSLDSTCPSLTQALLSGDESTALLELQGAIKGVFTWTRALHGLGLSASL